MVPYKIWGLVTLLKFITSYHEEGCQVLRKIKLVVLEENVQKVIVYEVDNEANFAQRLESLPGQKFIDPA